MSRYKSLEDAAVNRAQTTMNGEFAHIEAFADPTSIRSDSAYPQLSFFWEETKTFEVRAIAGVVWNHCDVQFKSWIFCKSDGLEPGSARLEAYDLMDLMREKFIGWTPTIPGFSMISPLVLAEEALVILEAGGYGIEATWILKAAFAENGGTNG